MQGNRTARLLSRVALLPALVGAFASTAVADVPLNGLNITYHGGALIQHVKVAPLLFGASWQGGPGAAYVHGFLQSLFADGRFMATLAQYNAGSLQIHNGTTLTPVLDPAVLPRVSPSLAAPGVLYQVTDAQIRAEIRSQIAASHLPAPDADTVYAVFLPSDVVAVQGNATSETDFVGYHDYDAGSHFIYAVSAPTGAQTSQSVNTPTGYNDTLFNRTLTAGISHELSEAVTDPMADGWFDEHQVFGGEIADIPVTLNGLGFITDDQLYDLLTGTNGMLYAVQKVWSNKDRAPVAFAATSAG